MLSVLLILSPNTKANGSIVFNSRPKASSLLGLHEPKTCGISPFSCQLPSSSDEAHTPSRQTAAPGGLGGSGSGGTSSSLGGGGGGSGSLPHQTSTPGNDHFNRYGRSFSNCTIHSSKYNQHRFRSCECWVFRKPSWCEDGGAISLRRVDPFWIRTGNGSTQCAF